MSVQRSADDLTKLKKQVEDVLRNESKGIVAGSFWNAFLKKFKSLPDPKKFNVSKRADLLDLCSEVFERQGAGNEAVLRLKVPLAATSNQPVVTTKSKVVASDTRAVAKKPSNSSDIGIEDAVEKLELTQSTMQPGRPNPSLFYDKFYSAERKNVPPQSVRGQTSNQGNDSLIKENPSHFAGGANAQPFSQVPVGMNVPSLVGFKVDAPASFVGSQQPAIAHRGFYGAPIALVADQQQRVLAIAPGMVPDQRKVPLPESSAGAWQQSANNLTYQRNAHQIQTNHPVSAANSNYSHPARSLPAKDVGRRVNFSRPQINSAAEDCIERLAAAKDYVSSERIEKLLLQHFEVESLQQLNLHYLDELASVKTHMRLLCKVNAYIQNFVKVRTICTVHELHEALREFTENRTDFETLKLGPLTKLPLIYELFKFPSDAEICELTTADVIDYLKQYLTENDAWTKQLSLEEFMKFLVEKRGLQNPYELGLRITSPPLAIQMLKKAQRDCGQTIRNAQKTLSQAVEMELDSAFRNFQSSVLRNEHSMCVVREEYLHKEPCEVLKLVLTKLRQLYGMVHNCQILWSHGNNAVMNASERKKINRTLELLNNFVAQLSTDVLLQKLFQIAVCCSQEQIHNYEFVQERPAEEYVDLESDKNDPWNESLPNIGEVTKAIKKYLDRVVQHGSVTLEMLSRIEQKLLEDFQLKHFAILQQGSFLDFLFRNEDLKKMLDEYGATVTGSASHSSHAESVYHVAADDILEFVKQCGTKEVGVIEAAVCHHYGCKDMKALGHGSLTALLNRKRSSQPSRDSAVFFDTALAARQLTSVHGQNRTAGIFGHMTREKALACLQNCPLLVNMAEWSQWDLVFKPELKDLRDFIQKHGLVRQLNIVDGGRNAVVTTDIVALEVGPGTLLRLTTRTAPDIFASFAVQGDARSTAGHLMSLVVQYRGVEEAPLALLGNHVKTALVQMQSKDSDFSEDADEFRTKPHVQFVLDCLTFLPLVTGHLIVKKVFLDVLSDVVGQARSKQLLLQHARGIEQRTRLQAYGMLLGIPEWTESFHQCTAFPRECIEIVPTDMASTAQSIVLVDSDSDEESELSSDIEITLSDVEDPDMNDVIEVPVEESKPSPTDAAIVVKDDEEQVVMDSSSESQEEPANKSAPKHPIPDVVPMENIQSTVVDTESDSLSVSGAVVDDTLMSPCRQFIESLRLEEFGVNVELSEDGQRLMKKQQERLGRSLERLSSDLYSKDTHFVLELIQNADDNDYVSSMFRQDAEEVPSLMFSVDPDCIAVYNNEAGFTERNIRAVCDVGKTTKGKHKFGYIGQKGIGFKSVFRVTERPEIHSNGFHIRFDVNSGPLGYILPHWIDEEHDTCDKTLTKKWTTCIRLPLRSEMQQRAATKTLAARFRDIQPSLLLFLHRLRSITIYNGMESYESVMTRRDLTDNIIEITHGAGCDRWLVVKKMLDASKISLQAKSGIEIESTELALAFPLLPKRNLTAQIPPPKQPVFAFLPLRSYGFRFIVQGDFDVPSSREEVDRDSMWNQWLRSEIAVLFVSTLDNFKELKELNDIEAVVTFLQFVPLEGEILDFFSPVAANIFQQLRAKPCLPTQGLQWRLPSQLVVTSDPLVREVISADLLRQCLDLDFLHPGVASILNSQMMNSLGVQTLNTQHLLEVGKRIVAHLPSADETDVMLNEVDIISVSKWLQCVHKSMDEFGQNEETLKHLRSMHMIPLSSGSVTSVSSDTVFFPLSITSEKRGILSLLEADMRTVHPLLLGSNVAMNSHICSLLEQLGVKRLTPRDVISHHILPILRSDSWKSKNEQLIVTYIMYIMEQSTQPSSVVNLDELRPLAVIRTNHGFVRPADHPVHFTPEFGNSIDLAKELPGFNWTLIDSCYISDIKSRLQVQEWRKFLSNLGVTDSLVIKQKDVTLSRSELSASVWSDYATILPSTSEQFVIADYQCEEFTTLVEHNTEPSSSIPQMMFLFHIMNRDWESQFKKFTVSKVMDITGQQVREIDTSFGLFLKILQWLPGVKGHGSYSLFRGSDLFIKTQQLNHLLANHVSYLCLGHGGVHPGSSFFSYLGIRQDINVDFVADCLKRWCTRTDDKVPTKFTTSIAHMKNVYDFLRDNMPRSKFSELVTGFPVIFYVEQPPNEMFTEVTGMFLKNTETVWIDPLCLFSKYHESLMDIAMLSTKSLCRYILQPVYPDRKEFFCSELQVQRTPDVDEFIQLLIHVATTCTVQKALSDVLTIFQHIGKRLEDDGKDRDGVRKLMRQHQEQLKMEKFIPNKNGIWVGLDGCPMIADDQKLEKLFAERPEVNFVDCGDKIAFGSGKGKTGDKDAREKIWKFLTEVGVRRLTECVKITPQTENYRPCPALQTYVRQVVPWIQRSLYTDEFSEIYAFLIDQGIKARLATMTFAQVGKLELVHSLTNLPEVIPVVFKENCRMVSESELVIHFEYVTSHLEVNRELARYFSCIDAPSCPCSLDVRQSCFRELKFILGELQPLLSLPVERMENLMREHDRETLPESEEVWDVKEPIVYMPPPRMMMTMMEKSESVASFEAAMEVSAEETTGIRSWPPRSHEHQGLTASGIKSSSTGASPMWPPPAPPQHIDRGHLPPNLRPSSLPRPGDVVRDENDSLVVERTVEGVATGPVSPRVGDVEPRDRQVVHKNEGHAGASVEQQLSCKSTDDIQSKNDGDELQTVHQARRASDSVPVTDCSMETNPPSGPDSGSSMKANPPSGPDSTLCVPQVTGKTLINYGDGSDFEEPIVIEFTTTSGGSGDNTVVRAGHKRARVNSGSSVDDVIKHSFVKQPVTFYGPPIWLSEVEESIYEQLGIGESLTLPSEITLSDDSDGQIIGHWGELLVNSYLHKLKGEPDSGLLEVIWANENFEKGLPYDFELIYRDDTRRYVEVKSTRSDRKACFGISVQQVLFAYEKGQNYHLYRVYCAGDTQRVRLARVDNVAQRLITKQLKLLMAI